MALAEVVTAVREMSANIAKEEGPKLESFLKIKQLTAVYQAAALVFGYSTLRGSWNHDETLIMTTPIEGTL